MALPMNKAKKRKPSQTAPLEPQIEQNACTSIASLNTKIQKLCNPPPTITEDKSSFAPKLFTDLPLSQNTQKSLKEHNLIKMTPIQSESILPALNHHDILGSAKTGSGKTLSFLIPVIENLYRIEWSKSQGVAAIIISPTRDLAMQIFSVLKRVGKFHSFSAGLIIGGNSKGIHLAGEKRRINQMNVLVCTPGRLLQHFDESAGFDCSNLQILVLDEADQLLELGFAKEIDAILKNLPVSRQTMLFSATLNNSVENLAKLSLVSPKIIDTPKNSSKATPSRLTQQYIITPAQDKLVLLHSFIKTHLNCKIIVFSSNRKQCQYLSIVFKNLHLGLPVLCIHGKHSLQKRCALLDRFKKSKKALLITTDLCSRGLDLPLVHWVISYDCPDSPREYIHRVGRAARYDKFGFALLFLLPSEKKAIESLKNRKIYLMAVKAKEDFAKKRELLSAQFKAILKTNENYMATAKKALSCYLRFVHRHRENSVMGPKTVDISALAISMGIGGSVKVVE